MSLKNHVLISTIATILVLSFMLRQTIQEKQRYQSNQSALLNDITTFKTKDSLNAAQVERLTLTNSEFRKYNVDQLQTISNLNLKVRRLQSASQSATQSQYIINTQIKDSLIYLPGKTDTLKCIQAKDKWFNLDGCIREKQFKGIVQTIDTLDTYIDRVPRKFLFIKYGTKAIRQTVVNKNPDSKIIYTEYIEFRK